MGDERCSACNGRGTDRGAKCGCGPYVAHVVDCGRPAAPCFLCKGTGGLNDAPMVQPLGSAPWWSYAEKDAWYDFTIAHPMEAAAIEKFCVSVRFTSENTTDLALTSGVQIEGINLRIAELLGMVEIDRPTLTT